MNKDYSKYYGMIDNTKYDFKEDGIYSKWKNKRIEGYLIGNVKKYPQFKFICTDGKQHSLYMHVALWIYFNGDIPNGYEIDHIKPVCEGGGYELSNLRLLTHLENMHQEGVQERKANGIRNSEKIRNRNKLK